MIYREPTKSCFCCGSQVPSSVRRIERGSSVVYECPECSDTILQGIVADGRSRAMSALRPPDRMPDHASAMPMRTDFRIWEMWWTDRLHLAMMHGRRIAGNEALADFVSEMQDHNDTRETR